MLRPVTGGAGEGRVTEMLSVLDAEAACANRAHVSTPLRAAEGPHAVVRTQAWTRALADRSAPP